MPLEASRSTPRPGFPAGASEEIAQAAVAGAVRRRCRGVSWQGLTRELAWRAVTGGGRDPRSVEALAEAAEAMLASLLDEALWAVERCAIEGWDEFVDHHRGDERAALEAAGLDAREEAERLVEAACASVLETLLATSRRAA
jgi:hypothetical protein